MSHFHPLEVVCRGSETQLQVGENLYDTFFNNISTIGPNNFPSIEAVNHAREAQLQVNDNLNLMFQGSIGSIVSSCI